MARGRSSRFPVRFYGYSEAFICLITMMNCRFVFRDGRKNYESGHLVGRRVLLTESSFGSFHQINCRRCRKRLSSDVLFLCRDR